MIRTRKDLHDYIKADFASQDMKHPFWAKYTFGENYAMYRYMRTLRKLEYYTNLKPNVISTVLKSFYLLKYRRNCLKYQIHISPNIVGKGFKIVHPGFRRVDAVVKRIGSNCTILPMVLFGKKKPDVQMGCIEVGNNCYLGAGCTILGPVKIGDNVTIGAGAVVTRDIPDGCTVTGVPAKIIKTT